MFRAFMFSHLYVFNIFLLNVHTIFIIIIIIIIIMNGLAD